MIIGGVMKPPNIEPTTFAAHAQNSKKVCIIPPSVIPSTTTASPDVHAVVNVVTPPLSTAACTQQILLGELSSKCRVTSTLPSSRDTTDVSNAPTAPLTVRAAIKKPVRPTTDYAPSASNQGNSAFSHII
jgi:hypothetical protein